jgi:hypothetical protein
LFGVLRLVFSKDLRDGVGGIVTAGIALLAESFDFFQLLAAELVDIFVECQGFL